MNTRDEQVREPATSNGFFHPHTSQQQEEVRKELRNVLAGPSFQNSKRYSAVLQFIVDQTLQGNGDTIKERTIGIEVFHRAPGYDTGTDHVVRSAVAEVRKRLAQHHQQNPNSRLRIEVLPGSYLPQFRSNEEHRSLAPWPPDISPARDNATANSPAIMKRFGSRIWLQPRRYTVHLVLVLSSVVALAGVVRGAYTRSHDLMESFWKPITSSRVPVLLCIGNVEGGLKPLEHATDLSLTPTLSLREFHNSPFETVNVYDAITMAKFAGLMEANGQHFELKSQSDATFTDFQNGPTILVGLLNNNWSERLVPELRFTVEEPDANKVIIRDRNRPSGPSWSVDYATPYLDVTRDYALVLRMRDPKTEQMVVAVAGITVFGTTAAGNFLTDKNEMRKLSAVAPPGWEKKNMELVLSTDVIRGQSGPATIVATQFW